MSYDIRLVDPVTRETVQFAEAHDLRGGTYQHGGTTEAWLNVTYNYGPHFRRVLGPGGIRSLYGQTAAATAPLLVAAIQQLGMDEDSDYWKPTEGNARAALVNLLTLADLAPNAVWEGD